MSQSVIQRKYNFADRARVSQSIYTVRNIQHQGESGTGTILLTPAPPPGQITVIKAFTWVEWFEPNFASQWFALKLHGSGTEIFRGGLCVFSGQMSIPRARENVITADVQVDLEWHYGDNDLVSADYIVEYQFADPTL